MKKVYYLGECGTGRSVHYELLDLVKEDSKKLLFHITTYDFDLEKERTITLKAEKIYRTNFNGELYQTINFKSTKEQFKFSFIREMEIADNEIPQKKFIENV